MKTVQTPRQDKSINFTIGHPSLSLLPLDLIQQASDHFFSKNDPSLLQYGYEQGDERFRKLLADFLTRHYGIEVKSDRLVTSNGVSQALDLLCNLLTTPGDTVLVEEPTYFLSLEIFRDHGLQVYSIDMDEDGVRIDQLREAAARYNPKFFYTIPVHQNPTGMTMSLERRHQVVELSSEYDFAIIADEVYHLLSYGDIPPPSFASFIGDHGIHAAGIDTGGIYALGSFSKILAPGLRLGWIECSQSRIKPIITYGQLNSGGALNPFVSGVITSMLELGLQDTHLSRLRETYAKRMQTMRGALHKHLPDSVHLNNPNGGYFFWLTCPESIDISRLDAAVKEKGTKFIAGPRFSPRGIQEHQIRLSFSYHDEAQIEEGVRRLGEAFSNL